MNSLGRSVASCGLTVYFVTLLAAVAFAAPGGDLRVVEAAKARDKEAMRALLKQQADVNARQADGATALHWAAHWDELETADLLIRGGAKVNAANDYGVTPLSLACSNGSAAMVEKLLGAGADPNSALPSGETALMTCARTGSADAVRALIARGADVSAREKEQGQTALMWAAAQKHAQVAQVLIEHRAGMSERSKNGLTPLLFAARSGDVETARVLLDAGVNVNEGMPLPAAAKAAADKTAVAVKGSEEGEVSLATRKAPSKENGGTVASGAAESEPEPAGGIAGYSFPAPDRLPGGMTALLMAAASGREALAIFLLQRGADPNAADIYGATALHYAVQRGIPNINGIVLANYTSAIFRPDMLELVKELLKHGANPNVRLLKSPPLGGRGGEGAVGATPFLLAASGADVEAMRVLAQGGADPLTPTKDGTTPLMAAAGVGMEQDRSAEEAKNSVEAVRIAVELGNDVNAANEDGLTAMHGAVNLGNDAIVQYLADKGAKLDVKDKFQQTPLTIASGIRLPWVPKEDTLGEVLRQSTADLLLKLGATPLNTPGYFTPVADSDAYRMNPKSLEVPGITPTRESAPATK